MAEKSRALFERLGLKHNVTKTSSGSEVHTYTSDRGSDSPILTLVHGYPQSAYEWRYVVPALIDKISLFVPELPGYGISSPCQQHSKKTVGSALLEALESVFKPGKERKVILGGHDRGARICHRLAVDKNDFPNLNLVGTALLDIVPTKVQWEAFADPVIAVGYFHWPLLANIDIATDMIEAYGADKWVHGAHSRIGGGNSAGQERIFANDAVEVYKENFNSRDTIYFTCQDYASGAAPEATEQAEDQKNGKKIEVPTLVMFSKAKLGARQDVAKIWKDWIKPGVSYEPVGVGDGYGHYLPEEAKDIVIESLTRFIQQFT